MSPPLSPMGCYQKKKKKSLEPEVKTKPQKSRSHQLSVTDPSSLWWWVFYQGFQTVDLTVGEMKSLASQSCSAQLLTDRGPGSELQVKAPSLDLSIHPGHRELPKMKARVTLFLHVLCHKSAGRPWMGHLTSLDQVPPSVTWEVYTTWSLRLCPLLECCDSLLAFSSLLVLAFSCTWGKNI